MPTKTEINKLADLVTAVKNAKEGDNASIEFDVQAISQEGSELIEKVQSLETENASLKDVSSKVETLEASNATLQSENTKLAEQVTALDTAYKKAKELGGNADESQAIIAQLQAQLNEEKARVAVLAVDNQLEKGIAGLVFDVNDSARNNRLADLCKSDWMAQFKTENREGNLVVIDKKTQSDVQGSISEHIRAFAKENGYTVKVPTGLNIASEVRENESAVADISYEDANSDNPKRKKAYQAKLDQVNAEFQKNGGLFNSNAHRKMLVEKGLKAPAQ
jgi:hypothetical protein